MMKLGMINNNPTEESLSYVRDLGLSFIEICCNNNEESAAFTANRDRFAAAVSEKGLFFGSVGRWNAEMNRGGQVNEEEFAIVRQNLADAISVGARTFACGVNYDPSISLYRNYTAAIEIFGRLLDAAKGTGTRVAAYNCSWNNFVNDIEAWKVVIGELPELMIKFDASHSYNAGRDYLREISEWGEHFAHVHIKGTVHAGSRGVADPPAGMDDLRWSSIFATLYARGYDGCLSIEPHSAAWQFDTERGKAGVRYTVDFIRRFIL